MMFVKQFKLPAIRQIESEDPMHSVMILINNTVLDS